MKTFLQSILVMLRVLALVVAFLAQSGTASAWSNETYSVFAIGLYKGSPALQFVIAAVDINSSR